MSDISEMNEEFENSTEPIALSTVYCVSGIMFPSILTMTESLTMFCFESWHSVEFELNSAANE